MTRAAQLLLAALLVVETAWWYTAFALGGVLIGLQGSPLNGGSIFLVLATAAVVALRLQNPNLNIAIGHGVSMMLGLATVYLAIAVSVESPITPAWRPLWVLESIAGDLSYRELGRQFFGVIFGVALWWRGMSIGATVSPDALLFRSFQIGLGLVTVGALVDAILTRDLGMTWVAFGFFLGGLGALILNQLQSEENEGMAKARWTQVALAAVGGVVIAGLFLSFLPGGTSTAVAETVVGAAANLLQRAVILVATPFAYLADYGFRGVEWILAHFFESGSGLEGARALELLREFEEQRSTGNQPGWVVVLTRIVIWGLVIYVAVLSVVLLYLAFVRKQREDTDRVVRTSTRGETPLWEDVASLLRSLLPDWSGRSSPDVVKPPPGSSPRARVLRLYYSTLEQGRRSGFPRHGNQTPLEYHHRGLSRVIPFQASARLTRGFNLVRYAHQEPSPEEIGSLEQEIHSALREREAGTTG